MPLHTPVVDSTARLIDEGVSLGLHEQELEEFRAHAGDAATADDLEAVYRLKGDLQERLLDAKRKQIVKRSMTEIESLGDLVMRSEEHTSELQSPCNLVCRLLLEKKKKNKKIH